MTFEMPEGTKADIRAHVNLAKVANNAFSSQKAVASFIEFGFKDCFDRLPFELSYADFGGAEGFLANEIKAFIEANGKVVNPVVLDANPSLLEEAKEAYGFETTCCDLVSYKKSKAYDIISMRSVLHYNPIKAQDKILANAYDALKNNGLLVCQMLSTAAVDCELISEILNLESLARTFEGDTFYLPTINEFELRLKAIGFQSCEHVCDVTSYPWRLENVWNRMHWYEAEQYEQAGNHDALSELESKKVIFMMEAKNLIGKHKAKHQASKFNTNFETEAFFPLIRVKK